MRAVLLSLGLLLASLSWAAPGYVPPQAAAATVAGINFDAQAVGEKYHDRFMECDAHNTCDGKPLKYGCSTDMNRNSALLRLKRDVLFFDAKMGLDADGSPYSRKTPGKTDQAETSLRYPLPGRPSIDADRVPFIVIPLGGFGQSLGVSTGDVAAVVYGDKQVFAVVADAGPACKIGEGSIQLHEKLGHAVCRQRDANGHCTKLTQAGIAGDVLYFVFPGTSKLLLPGLTPQNIDERLQRIGSQAWQGLKAP